MFAAILAAISGFFEFFKEATGLWNDVAPSTSTKIGNDESDIDKTIDASDKSGRP